MEDKGVTLALQMAGTVDPQCNEGPRDWQNLFAITRFRYIEVLFHIFYYYWGNENHLLYGGLRYIEVRYIEVPLYFGWLAGGQCCSSRYTVVMQYVNEFEKKKENEI